MSADERTLGERVEDVRLVLSTDMFRKGLHRAHTMVIQEADDLLRDLQAEIERLTEVSRQITVENRVGGLLHKATIAERDSLRRDLEAARVDAERYRWLQQHLNGSGETFSETAFSIRSGAIPPEQWDAAIDLARARGEG